MRTSARVTSIHVEKWRIELPLLQDFYGVTGIGEVSLDCNPEATVTAEADSDSSTDSPPGQARPES